MENCRVTKEKKEKKNRCSRQEDRRDCGRWFSFSLPLLRAELQVCGIDGTVSDLVCGEQSDLSERSLLPRQKHKMRPCQASASCQDSVAQDCNWNEGRNRK